MQHSRSKERQEMQISSQGVSAHAHLKSDTVARSDGVSCSMVPSASSRSAFTSRGSAAASAVHSAALKQTPRFVGASAALLRSCVGAACVFVRQGRCTDKNVLCCVWNDTTYARGVVYIALYPLGSSSHLSVRDQSPQYFTLLQVLVLVGKLQQHLTL